MFACFGGGPEDWQQREQGSDLSPLSKASLLPTTPHLQLLKQRACCSNGCDWGGGYPGSKVPSSFQKGSHRSPGARRGIQISLRGGWVLEMALQVLVVISHSLAELPLFQLSVLHLTSLNLGVGEEAWGEVGEGEGKGKMDIKPQGIHWPACQTTFVSLGY